MTVSLANKDAFMSAAFKELEAFEKQCVEEVKLATRTVVSELFLNTPVWEGETVRNYAVGVGSMPAGGTKAHLGPSPPPRPTNQLTMGTEDNRPANESAARGDMEGAIGAMKKLEDVFVTNLVSAQKWDLIDNGSAPSPDTARNPGGTSVLSVQSARAKLGNFK